MVDGDKSCLRYSIKDQVEFIYNFNCEFIEPREDALPYDDTLPFKYYLAPNSPDDSFAASLPLNATTKRNTNKQQQNNNNNNNNNDLINRNNNRITLNISPFEFVLYVVDFNRLFSEKMTAKKMLSQEELIGEGKINLELELGKAEEEKLIFGNRIYIEAGLDRQNSLPGLNRMEYDRRFIDITEQLKARKAEEEPLEAWEIALIVVFSVIFVIGCLIIVRIVYIKKFKQQGG